METITEIRKHYVEFGGSSGGWNVLLENFEAHQGYSHKIAVSKPFPPQGWLKRELGELAREIEVGGGLVILVIDDWVLLEKRVRAAALWHRLLVMITGNLVGESWEKAKKFSGRTDGLISRSRAGVAVGEPYWYPSDEQLVSVN